MTRFQDFFSFQNNVQVCSSSIIGENVSRFNEIETRDRIATELAEGENRKDSESGSQGGEKESKVFISKSIVGPKCQFEYDLTDNKKKTTRITNCFIHNEVKIRTGVKLNNCIISRGAVLGEQEKVKILLWLFIRMIKSGYNEFDQTIYDFGAQLSV